MAFGFTLPQRGVFFGVTTVSEMLALTAKADANPLFDSVWVGDSLGAKPRPDSIARLERALQRVAHLADGWMTTRLTLGLARSNWSGIARALEAEGRDPGTFP